jgi:hypothetical protein
MIRVWLPVSVDSTQEIFFEIHCVESVSAFIKVSVDVGVLDIVQLLWSALNLSTYVSFEVPYS